MNYSYGKQSIDSGDVQEVMKVLKSPFLTQGPKIEEFEQAICEYTGAKYASMMESETDDTIRSVRKVIGAYRQ